METGPYDVAEIWEQTGSGPIEALVAHFYEGVAVDPILRPLYPTDLDGARERLALFLIQRFGGPTTYSDRRGHPRLRMRHVPFTIGAAERDAWMRVMRAALAQVPELAPHRESIDHYFAGTAEFLVNAPNVEVS